MPDTRSDILNDHLVLWDGEAAMAVWVRRDRADGVSGQIKWRHDGRWQSETFTNLKLASEFRTAVEVAGHEWPKDWVRGQGWVAPTPPPVRVTFAEVATGEGGYFEQQAWRVKRGKLKPYTLHRDRRTYALHFEELFGHVVFEELGAEEIGDWVDDQVEAGSAAKTIRNRHGLLSSIMKHGRMRMGLRVDNPCELTELPDLDTATCEARQIRFFQQSEWALLRACLQPDIQLALDVDLATGLRWGELDNDRSGLLYSGYSCRASSRPFARQIRCPARMARTGASVAAHTAAEPDVPPDGGSGTLGLNAATARALSGGDCGYVVGMSPRYAEGDLVTAVGVWADFPVDAVPRPYVLTQSAVIEAGYQTGDAKLAFIEGRVRFAEGLPDAAAAALVAGGVRLSPGSPALLVTNATRVGHPFRTDRGERMLPAWSLDVQDSLGPVVVLDDEPGNSWRPVTYPYVRHWYSQDTATVNDHGTVLTYRFWGSPEIYIDYPDAQVLQAATAVAIAPRAVGGRAVDRAGMVAPLLSVQIRTVTVRLDQPLGQRVLVNANGLAVDAAFET